MNSLISAQPTLLRKYPQILQEPLSLSAILSFPPPDSPSPSLLLPPANVLLQDLEVSELILGDQDRTCLAYCQKAAGCSFAEELHPSHEPLDASPPKAEPNPAAKVTHELNTMLEYIRAYRARKAERAHPRNEGPQQRPRRRTKTRRELEILRELAVCAMNSPAWEAKRAEAMRITGLTIQQINKWHWDQINRRRPTHDGGSTSDGGR